MATEKKAPDEEPKKCLNHPDQDAVLDSDLGGAIQPIQLCQLCVDKNSNLQKFV